jgi:hypothetical protein
MPRATTPATQMPELIINDSPAHEVDALLTRIRAIESAANSGSYRPGEWTRRVNEVQRLKRADRVALIEDVSRASLVLHRRHVARTISIRRAISVEVILAVVGAMLIVLGGAKDSSVLGAIGAFAWMAAFQPLIEYTTGRALGIEYEYAYLFGIEPRLKMRYGSYLAAPRWARVLLHVAGTLGSPLGALLGWAVMPPQFVAARYFCLGAFSAFTLVNLVLLIAGLAGVRKVCGFGMTLSSGGGTAREIREGIRLRDFG